MSIYNQTRKMELTNFEIVLKELQIPTTILKKKFDQWDLRIKLAHP